MRKLFSRLFKRFNNNDLLVGISVAIVAALIMVFGANYLSKYNTKPTNNLNLKSINYQDSVEYKRLQFDFQYQYLLSLISEDQFLLDSISITNYKKMRENFAFNKKQMLFPLRGRTDQSEFLNYSKKIPKQISSDQMAFPFLSDNEFLGKNFHLKYEEGKLISLKEEVANLFDPKNHPCSLPSNILKKLDKLKKSNAPWIPKYIVSQLENYKEVALYYPGQNLSHFLHTVKIFKQNDSGNFSLRTIYGAPTYNDFNIGNFIVKGKSNFFYSLDCAGYLSAVMEFTGIVPVAADIRSIAKSSLEIQNSFFVGGGTIISPIAAACFGNSYLEMDSAIRIKILQQIIELPGLRENDTVVFNPIYNAIWSSKNGSSSFNGEAKINLNAGVSFTVASLSGSSEAQGSLIRKSFFADYKTFIVLPDLTENLPPLTIKNIKETLSKLQKVNTKIIRKPPK